MSSIKRLKSLIRRNSGKLSVREERKNLSQLSDTLKSLLSSPGKIFNAPVPILVLLGSGLFAFIFATVYFLLLFSGPLSPLRPRPQADVQIPSDGELRRKAVDADLKSERAKQQEALERRNKIRNEYSALLAELDSVQPLLDEAIREINTRALDEFTARQAKVAAEAQKKREEELQEKSAKKESNRRLLVCITAERNFQQAMARGDSKAMSQYDGIVKQNCN